MNAKSSAHYQREYRKRLREQGFVKKEVWILPENAKALLDAEKTLRKPETALTRDKRSQIFSTVEPWTNRTLASELARSEFAADASVTVELVEGLSSSIHLTMHDYGDLPLFLSVSGEQILVEALMWPADEVVDIDRFNDLMLRSHKYLPLSTVCLDRLDDGQDYYQMFGALAASSSLNEIIVEIDLLASNVINAAEASASSLRSAS